MTLVATLISNPAAPALDSAAIERASGALPSAQAPIWLDPGVAADVPFTGTQENTQASDNGALAGVEVALRRVMPMVEFRSSFELGQQFELRQHWTSSMLASRSGRTKMGATYIV